MPQTTAPSFGISGHECKNHLPANGLKPKVVGLILGVSSLTGLRDASLLSRRTTCARDANGVTGCIAKAIISGAPNAGTPTNV